MEGEICESRYCDVGTIMEESTTTVNPTKYVKEYEMPKKNVPKKMDDTHLRREHVERREYTRDLIAKNEQKLKVRSHLVENAGLVQMQLELILAGLQKEGVQYSSISTYFDQLIRDAEVAREIKHIISDMLVRDREQLRDSDACYAHALAELRRRRGFNLESISVAVEDLGKVLRFRG